MSARVFIGWIVATVAMVVLALVIVLDRQTASFDPIGGDPAFPALRADPNAAARITVANKYREFTVVRRDDGWYAPDKYDFPVDPTEPRDLLVKLSDMRLIESKTRRPDRYGRLEVEDIKVEEAASRYVRVEDAGGKVLAEAILGRPSYRFVTGSTNGTYFRRPNEDRAWLGTGVVRVQERLIPWLAREIVDLEADTIKRIDIGVGTDAHIVLERASPEAKDFAIASLPDGREIDKSGPIGRIARSLKELRLEDVKPVAEVVLPDDRKVARVETFDGVAVTLEMAMLEKRVWARFDAAYVGSGDEDAAKAAQATVEELKARYATWGYWLPESVFTGLTRPLEEFLVKPKDDDTS